MKLSSALVSALALLPLCSATAESHPHWSYEGKTGPAHWGELEPDFATCAKGSAQSPIDIQTAKAHPQSLPPLQFSYELSALHIIDNGHTIQVNVPAGSHLVVGHDHYTLVQFHFHHPSEEAINGKHSEMVVHLVHRDAKGHLAVVAVLLQAGAPNPTVSTLWQNLPHHVGHEDAPAHVKINTAALLPQGRAYYTYSGSLTTPPCSQGVHWFVLKSPVTVSATQMATFSRLYPGNARTVQPLHGRAILSSK